MARTKTPQKSLFPDASARLDRPLADRMRPTSLDEVVGQPHLVGQGKLLRRVIQARSLPSLIFWGPPGSGKTTLALLLAEASGMAVQRLAAVSAGVAELREAVEGARERLAAGAQRTVVFIDEIHRWNRAQQDAFLPHVENGLITLIGATTENPSFHVIAPLLSRSRVLVLQPLGERELAALVERALGDGDKGLGKLGLHLEARALETLIRAADGDARRALNTLEVAAMLAHQAGRNAIVRDDLEQAVQRRMLLYDRAGEEHYNLISAFIKSLRGSDPDAALYWMTRMLEAGEEPLFIARRMVIFAAEDIGNADPQALAMANAVKEAAEFVGLPECAIPLAQGTTYLATAPKSNASYRALLAAREDARTQGALPVPLHLRNAPTELMQELGYGAGYQYPHDFPDAAVAQDFLPERLRNRRYYEPTDRGYELVVRRRMAAHRRHAAGSQSDRVGKEPRD